MKILIELPTWLGDCVMATPAVESMLQAYPDAYVTIVGSYVSTEALKAHPRIGRVFVDTTKKRGMRFLNLYKLAKEIGPHDIAVSFRSHLYSKALLYLTGTHKRYVYNKNLLTLSPSHPLTPAHQVQKYQAFINTVTGRSDEPGPLKLHWPAKTFEKPTLGITPAPPTAAPSGGIPKSSPKRPQRSPTGSTSLSSGGRRKPTSRVTSRRWFVKEA